MAHMVKNPPAMQETWVRSLSWEDLEMGMATHTSILAWRNPQGQNLVGYIVHGVTKSEMTELLTLSTLPHLP